MARHRGAVAAVNDIVRGRGAEMGRAEREGRDGDGKRKIGSPRCDSREYGCAACGWSETGAWSLTHLWRQSDGRMPGRRGQLRAWHDTRTCEGNLASEPVRFHIVVGQYGQVALGLIRHRAALCSGPGKSFSIFKVFFNCVQMIKLLKYKKGSSKAPKISKLGMVVDNFK
jgi:hypothetical protein